MAKWKIQDKAEFEARQGCLEFGDACRFVLDLAASVKASLGAWTTGFLRNFRMPRTEKKPKQLRLNLMHWLMPVAATA